jgi:hypothetical protein
MTEEDWKVATEINNQREEEYRLNEIKKNSMLSLENNLEIGNMKHELNRLTFN